MTEIKLPFVLGLAGRKGVGKTHIARGLEERGWVRMSYADGVRELALALDPYVDFYDAGRGEVVGITLNDMIDGHGWDDAKKNDEVRRILQVVGTEMCRTIDPDIWVKKLAERVYKLPPTAKVVIDDVRFPNEANKIRHAWGGKVALIAGGQEGDDHESESHFGNLDASFTLGGWDDSFPTLDDLVIAGIEL